MAEEQTCVELGHCAKHGVEVERRIQDRTRIENLEHKCRQHEIELEIKLGNIWSHLSRSRSLIYGVFISMGLLLCINLGAYYFANTINTANDRGEEILLAKINRVERDFKLSQAEIMTSVVTLLTSDAEQREWQKGMVRQLELINYNLRKAMERDNGYHMDNDDHYTLPPTGAGRNE